MKNIFLLLIFLCGITPVFSQNHSTCDDAIPVTTPIYGPVSAKNFADASLCLPKHKDMYLTKPHLVVWFSFVIPHDTMLTFQIIPENATDDFDFMLFKANKNDFCEKEKKKKIHPIRTNFSKSTTDNKGITGLSEEATKTMVKPGINPAFSSAINVKKGEVYYLAVDNYTNDNGGFVLKLPFMVNATIASVKAPITVEPAKIPTPVAPPRAANAPNFFIHLMDSANHPVKANLVIDSVEKDNTIDVDTTDYSLLLKKDQTIKIRVNAVGEMPYQTSYTAKGDSAGTISVHLKSIKPAGEMVLKDIKFENDSPNILASSTTSLQYLLKFMLNNPSVKIIIKGYVNDPNHAQTENYDKALSEARANSVKKYLVSHSVDRKRMQCVGYGSSQMVFPNPVNEAQKAANRRVEIEIQ